MAHSAAAAAAAAAARRSPAASGRSLANHRRKRAAAAVLLLLCALGAAAASSGAAGGSGGGGGRGSSGGSGFTTGSQPQRSAADVAADAALWRWLEEGGAVLKFAPGYSAGGVRGGYATEGIPKGGLVASIPMRLVFRFPSDWKSFVSLGEHLASEAARADSPYRPYFDSLPSLADCRRALSWESFPPEYMHLLGGAAPLAERVLTMQAATLRYWSRHGLRLMEAGIGLERLRGALVTITTRWYQGPHEGRSERPAMALIPAYDMLNHRNGCPVHYDFEPCAHGAPAAAGETCCVVRTGEAIPSGAEVCNSYNHLSPDLALFHYGFELPSPPPGAAAQPGGGAAGPPGGGAAGPAGGGAAGPPGGGGALPPLSIIDARGFEPADLRRAHHDAPARFEGAPWAMAHERARLTETLRLLRATQPAAERTRPAPGDARGEVLRMVLAWRRGRAEAIEAEVARLGAAIAAAGGGARGKPGGEL
ncbi:hypothetical protein Rsub_06508 [Raphidocelis subcapitata]|uniref:SET domain-containing protein n=1 Tax=Raphidocelis subcapitata TaxID=307507 RepID=A0A2V0P2Z4_9CHLO|nr:hypothetical protein Rsub_06508 [Raphidocelis subcapitata]|eukprot:GBF94238.1 hypothetical protein Rsub_06508 [Raphidocelis subcapitata]